MDYLNHFAYMPMTPSDVLAIFQDWYRFDIKLYPEVEPDLEINFETKIAKCQSANFLTGRSFNDWFGIDASDREWRDVFEPRDQDLRGVCEFISAKGAKKPVVIPWSIAERTCYEAGAFLGIRALLIQSGVPAQTIRPSTSLEEIARGHLGKLITVVGKLAPGVLPVPQIQESYLQRIGGRLFLHGLAFLGLVFLLTGGPALDLFLVSVGILAIIIGGYLPFDAVDFGPLGTFADLARSIVSFGHTA